MASSKSNCPPIYFTQMKTTSRDSPHPVKMFSIVSFLDPIEPSPRIELGLPAYETGVRPSYCKGLFAAAGDQRIELCEDAFGERLDPRSSPKRKKPEPFGVPASWIFLWRSLRSRVVSNRSGGSPDARVPDRNRRTGESRPWRNSAWLRSLRLSVEPTWLAYPG